MTRLTGRICGVFPSLDCRKGGYFSGVTKTLNLQRLLEFELIPVAVEEKLSIPYYIVYFSYQPLRNKILPYSLLPCTRPFNIKTAVTQGSNTT
jgi:hypothetical protein